MLHMSEIIPSLINRSIHIAGQLRGSWIFFCPISLQLAIMFSQNIAIPVALIIIQADDCNAKKLLIDITMRSRCQLNVRHPSLALLLATLIRR